MLNIFIKLFTAEIVFKQHYRKNLRPLIQSSREKQANKDLRGRKANPVSQETTDSTEMMEMMVPMVPRAPRGNRVNKAPRAHKAQKEKKVGQDVTFKNRTTFFGFFVLRI